MLLQVCAKVWGGFCASLLVEIVDFILFVEDETIQNGSIDMGSARKLYFLAAWVRLLLSRRFLAGIRHDYAANYRNTGKKTDLELASSTEIDVLRYPLNSLCDRCSESATISEYRKTSQEILVAMLGVLGDKRVVNGTVNGTATLEDYPKVDTVEVPQSQVPKFLPREETSNQLSPTSETKNAMSLDDMEALLADSDGVDKTEFKQKTAGDYGVIPESLPNESVKLQSQRPAWVKCTHWDPCSLGTLPGYPACFQ